MRALRCEDCGDTRWSLMARKPVAEPGPCQLCGGAMVPERRTPTIGIAADGVERREAAAVGSDAAPATR